MRYDDDDNYEHFQDMKRDINSNFNDFRMNLHLINTKNFQLLLSYGDLVENYLEILHTIKTNYKLIIQLKLETWKNLDSSFACFIDSQFVLQIQKQ